MQKLDAGAILVNGKEELPLGNYESTLQEKSKIFRSEKKSSKDEKMVDEELEKRRIPIDDQTPEESPLLRRRRPRNRPRRYYSDDEVIGVHASRKYRHNNPPQTNNDVLFTNGLNNHEDTENLSENNDNGHENPRLLDTNRDKNANARLTRASTYDCGQRQSATLPRRRRRRAMSGSIIGNPLPPHRVTPDGTAIYYWCELPRRPGSQGKILIPPARLHQ